MAEPHAQASTFELRAAGTPSLALMQLSPASAVAAKLGVWHDLPTTDQQCGIESREVRTLGAGASTVSSDFPPRAHALSPAPPSSALALVSETAIKLEGRDRDALTHCESAVTVPALQLQSSTLGLVVDRVIGVRTSQISVHTNNVPPSRKSTHSVCVPCKSLASSTRDQYIVKTLSNNKLTDNGVSLHECSAPPHTASDVDHAKVEPVQMNVIELGGLQVQMAQPCSMVCLAGCKTSSRPHSHRRASERPSVVEYLAPRFALQQRGDWGQTLFKFEDTSVVITNQQSPTLRREDRHTMRQVVQTNVDYPLPLIICAAPFASSFTPHSPPAQSFVMDFKKFGVVSAIFLTCRTTHLVWVFRKELALCKFWAREGIGTRCKIFDSTGTGVRDMH
ncbi:hypothetical protein B0H13DRAFT_1885368 [Mycena leptocephala]|nr:hypothetical protein B0H13DRAFT_1885368 [Mycena leptocephala]